MEVIFRFGRKALWAGENWELLGHRFIL